MKTHFVCGNCAAVVKKWTGKCEECDSWNSFVEESIAGVKKVAKGVNKAFESLNAIVEQPPRLSSTILELDLVLGGGLVKGSAILIGGDPGIGKSTLLLQLVANLAKNNVNTAYITGEESLAQVRLRAERLALRDAPTKLLGATSVNEIISVISGTKDLALLVIDSIQTMFVEELTSSAGTVSQVRASAHELITFAKSAGIILILVGHVTKEGQIAGPKVLEHMVDTVLYFEGEQHGGHFRLIRSVKNRFGGVNEIGVFEMGDKGLMEIANPSSLFLSLRENNISGMSVFAGIEGSRCILNEVQALISPSMMSMPRRAVVGWDINRLAMVLAVLNVRYGINLADKEIYLNVAGGLKINEPAADLAMASALISASCNVACPNNCIIFGEIGLSGEIRSVNHTNIRLKEAVKLGFTRAIIPAKSKYLPIEGIDIKEISHIKELKDIYRR